MSTTAEMINTRYDTRVKWQRRIRLALLTVVLMLFTLIVIIPFIWMVMLSLRTTGEILNDPYGLPSAPRWENYRKLMFDEDIKFYRFFLNSTFVTGFAILFTTILSTLGGYGFARQRYQFRFRGWLFMLLLFALMLPVQVLYLPQYRLMGEYGLLGSRWGLVLVYTALGLPVSTYLMSTYFAQLPSELEDAAQIDGCGHFRTFLQVMLPIARPALATVILLNFMHFWNELLLSITMLTDPEKRTLPAAMMMFVGENAADYGIAAASLVSAMLPVLMLYIVLSDRFIEGLTAGAVKG